MGMPVSLPLDVICSNASCRYIYSLTARDDIHLYCFEDESWLDWFQYTCPGCDDFSYIYLWEYGADPRIYHRLRYGFKAVVCDGLLSDEGSRRQFAETVGFWPPFERDDNELLDAEVAILDALYHAKSPVDFFRRMADAPE